MDSPAKRFTCVKFETAGMNYTEIQIDMSKELIMSFPSSIEVTVVVMGMLEPRPTIYRQFDIVYWLDYEWPKTRH